MGCLDGGRDGRGKGGGAGALDGCKDGAESCRSEKGSGRVVSQDVAGLGRCEKEAGIDRVLAPFAGRGEPERFFALEQVSMGRFADDDDFIDLWRAGEEIEAIEGDGFAAKREVLLGDGASHAGADAAGEKDEAGRRQSHGRNFNISAERREGPKQSFGPSREP